MEEKDNIVDVESEVIEEKKVDNTGNSNQNDQSKTILFSILSYIGILWLIPLLVEKNDKVVRFHVNQGDRKSTRLNSSHSGQSRMPSSA